MEDLKTLLCRAQAGDREAFDPVVRRFQDMAVGYAYALLGDFHLAEDAAQEAFLGAWRGLPQLRATEAFANWFQKIVFLTCQQYRRRKRLATVPLDMAAEQICPAPGPAELAEGREQRDGLLELIRSLPETER